MDCVTLERNPGRHNKVADRAHRGQSEKETCHILGVKRKKNIKFILGCWFLKQTRHKNPPTGTFTHVQSNARLCWSDVFHDVPHLVSLLRFRESCLNRKWWQEWDRELSVDSTPLNATSIQVYCGFYHMAPFYLICCLVTVKYLCLVVSLCWTSLFFLHRDAVLSGNNYSSK